MPSPPGSPGRNVATMLDRFQTDLRQQGLHVGMGGGSKRAVCVSCGRPWPCPSSMLPRGPRDAA